MKLEFGRHKRKTLEWAFFNAPWYVDWMHKNGVHMNQFHGDDLEYFRELYRRASSLTGLCSYCKKRQVTRMGLTNMSNTGMLGSVGFYCDECEYTGGGPTEYVSPTFWTHMTWMPRCEQLMITRAIKDRYIGWEYRLTQKRMEEFFMNDANFLDATEGVFPQFEAV